MKRILCIDDSINFLQVIKKRFEFELKGIEFFTAFSGEEGLEKIKKIKPDLIFLDVNMPYMNGEEVLSSVKADKQMKDIPVFIITSVDIEEKNKYIAMGAVDFFASPFDIGEIIEKAKKILFSDDNDKDDNGLISIEDVMKLDLRIAEIIEAAEHPNADKLLVLKIKLNDGERQIVAGIKKAYAPDDLIGKKIVVVANLKPAVLRGEESRGMLLAASDDSGLALLVPDTDIKVGSKVK